MEEKVAHIELLSVAQVAKWLNISQKMVYKLIKTGDLPAIQIGRRLLLRSGDVQTFIDKNQVGMDEFDF